MWQQYNPNPRGNNVGDCTTRALTAALNIDWDTAYLLQFAEGYSLKDMPSADNVWGSVLQRHGFHRRLVEGDCPICYTVRDFAREHPQGTYLVCPQNHVVCIRDGEWWDAWDSGDTVPIYYWVKED